VLAGVQGGGVVASAGCGGGVEGGLMAQVGKIRGRGYRIIFWASTVLIAIQVARPILVLELMTGGS
jgi:hypothetical protein